MIGRQVIETTKAFTLEELERFMRENWDTDEYNDFFIGKPTMASVEEYILLPATRRFMVIVYPRAAGGFFNKKNKVILSVCDSPAGVGDRLRSSIPSSNIFYGIWATSESFSIEKERKGPAEEVLGEYTAYMHKLLKENGFEK